MICDLVQFSDVCQRPLTIFGRGSYISLKTSYEYVAEIRSDVWKHKPEEFVDASFVEELDKSGIIKRLYEK
jgi:hypothetical protein